MNNLLITILRKNIIALNILFACIGVVVYVGFENFYIEQKKISFSYQIDTILSFLDNRKTFLDIKDNNLIILNNSASVIKNGNFTYNDKYVVKANERGYFIEKKDNFLYIYKKIVFNKRVYFFIKKERFSFNNYFFQVSSIILILYLLFFIFLYFSSKQISKDINNEIKNLIDFLKTIPKQKRYAKLELNYSDEFNKISRIATKLSKILFKKNKKYQKELAKLKLTNQQKDEIISAISHEFKNPIAVISGYVQTLQQNSLDSKAKEKFLSKIDFNANKISNLIDRLRLFIKLDNQKQPYKFNSVDICKIAKDIIDDLKIKYKNREIELNCYDEVIIDVDNSLFGIVIENLVENGLKYSQEKVIVNLYKDRLEVVDFGIGIKEEDIDKITEKFYRVSSNGWNNSLGIGLTLVKNIIKVHKFRLQISSTVNEGSTFSVLF